MINLYYCPILGLKYWTFNTPKEKYTHFTPSLKSKKRSRTMFKTNQNRESKYIKIEE